MEIFIKRCIFERENKSMLLWWEKIVLVGQAICLTAFFRGGFSLLYWDQITHFD